MELVLFFVLNTFKPLGMKGTKKVRDFMIDSKIPLTLKKDVLILRSQAEIAWIIGYRLDDRFKVTAETKKNASSAIAQ